MNQNETLSNLQRNNSSKYQTTITNKMQESLNTRPPLVRTIEQSNKEPVYQGNTGNDMGISSVGFRTGRYNPNEWQGHNYEKYYQAFTDRDNSEKNRHESDRLIKETDATTKRNQDTATKKMRERIHDITFWKTELEREWQDMVDETETLVSEKKRFENALKATEIVMHIATDNLNCRGRRYGIDNVEDEVELALIKELDIIQKVQDLYKRTLKEIDIQIARNHSAKENVEMDWSNKKEAHEYDSYGANLTNGCTNKQFYDGVSKFQEFSSLPEDWAQHSHDNIVRSENERMASQQLRTLIINIIDDCTRDMRQQADIVERSFGFSIDQLEDARKKSEDNLKQNVNEIAKQESKIRDLKEAIKAKDDPIKVAQSRLHARSFRPGVDLCRDAPQHQLLGELNELQQSVDALMNQLRESEGALKNLMDTRMALEKEINSKVNTIFIEKDKCLTHRTCFPTMQRLRGFQ